MKKCIILFVSLFLFFLFTHSSFAGNTFIGWYAGESDEWYQGAGATAVIQTVLTDTSPNLTINAGTDALVYGTESSNQITLESSAEATLINFPGSNTITIQSNSGLFTVSCSGAYVTFEGTDNTVLKIPATTASQTIVFDDATTSLIIDSGQIMLGGQTVGLTPAEITITGNGPVALGNPEELLSQNILQAGDMITVNNPGHPLHSMEIIVPPGAYNETKPFRISSAPINSHTFGELFQPLTPMIIIENGGEQSEETMTVKIPVQIPEDQFAMAFFYNENQGKLEPMQLISVETDSIIVATRHFSNLVVTGIARSVLDAYLAEGIRSNFFPGVDDWSYVNRGSYIESVGHCAGQSLGALWYFTTKPDGDEHLWGKYDNNLRDWRSPDFWQDDSYAYRFSSVLQKDIDWTSFSMKLWRELQGRVWRLINNQWELVDVPAIGPEATRNLFALSMLLTEREPQYVGIYSDSGGGHAMIVYAVTQDALHIADPNYPGDMTRVIYYSNGAFDPYPSGDNWEEINAGKGKNYEHILYFSKSTLMPWDKIAQRWEEVRNGTIGNDSFPGYQIEYLDGESGEYKILAENQVFTESKVRFGSSGAGEASIGTLIYRDGEQLPFDAEWKIDLNPGDNLLGFHIMGKVNDKWKYVDFVYVNVSYEPEASVKLLGISLMPRSSDKPSSYPTIFGGNFNLPLSISATGLITYDFTKKFESDGEIRVTRIWGTGSYDGTLLTLNGSFSCAATGGPYSFYLTQNDLGTFSLETRGYWDEPLAETHATSIRVTEDGTLESLNQTVYFTVDDLTQLD